MTTIERAVLWLEGMAEGRGGNPPIVSLEVWVQGKQLEIPLADLRLAADLTEFVRNLYAERNDGCASLDLRLGDVSALAARIKECEE